MKKINLDALGRIRVVQLHEDDEAMQQLSLICQAGYYYSLQSASSDASFCLKEGDAMQIMEENKAIGYSLLKFSYTRLCLAWTLSMFMASCLCCGLIQMFDRNEKGSLQSSVMGLGWVEKTLLSSLLLEMSIIQSLGLKRRGDMPYEGRATIFSNLDQFSTLMDCMDTPLGLALRMFGQDTIAVTMSHRYGETKLYLFQS